MILLGNSDFLGLPKTSYDFPVFIRAPNRTGGEAGGSYEDRKVLGSPRKS